MKQVKKNKMTPAYGPEELIVVEVRGSTVIVSDGYRTICRDGSYFKRLVTKDDELQEEDEEDDPAEQQPEPEVGADTGENADPPAVQEEPDNTDTGVPKYQADTGVPKRKRTPTTPDPKTAAEERPKRECRKPVRFRDYVP